MDSGPPHREATSNMPEISGKKMAWSTTCDHAKERVMVPVRKPGRPLNACPHPPGVKCGCSDVTVAIPRKRRCDCVRSHTTELPRCGISRRSSKERFRPYGSSQKPATARDMSTYIQPTATHVPSASRFDMGLEAVSGPPWDLDSGPLATPSDEHSMQDLFAPALRTSRLERSRNDNILPDTEPELNTDLDASPTEILMNGSLAASSCCSRQPHPAQYMPPSESSSPTSTVSSYAARSRSSSISRIEPRMNQSLMMAIISNNPPAVANQPTYAPLVQQPLMEAPMQPTTSHPTACSNCGHGQPTVLMYPPNGSLLHPAGPPRWQQSTGAGRLVYAIYPNGTVGPPADLPAYAQTSARAESVGCSSSSLGTIHECGCGPGCECIGCIAHPFNQTTQEYIRSAYQDAFEGHDLEHQTYSQPLEPHTVLAPRTQSLHNPNLDISAEQTLSADDFFFVEYSITGDNYRG
ncbi:hypothetical protein BJ170DRAFT_600313 [Xylariales sp. AK1849]|nr:hypothetical protein BJ170DRAFT_600313 [Xylariales sp. AK1849]